MRFWDWLSDPEDWVINASNKSVNALVNPLFLGADLDFKQPPPHVRDLIAKSEEARATRRSASHLLCVERLRV